MRPLALLLVFAFCLTATSCQSCGSGACSVYLAKRPSVAVNDTLETQRAVLDLDTSMAAVCQ